MSSHCCDYVSIPSSSGRSSKTNPGGAPGSSLSQSLLLQVGLLRPRPGTSRKQRLVSIPSSSGRSSKAPWVRCGPSFLVSIPSSSGRSSKRFEMSVHTRWGVSIPSSSGRSSKQMKYLRFKMQREESQSLLLQVGLLRCCDYSQQHFKSQSLLLQVGLLSSPTSCVSRRRGLNPFFFSTSS